MRMRKCTDTSHTSARPCPKTTFFWKNQSSKAALWQVASGRGNGAKGLPNGYRAFHTTATGNSGPNGCPYKKSLQTYPKIYFTCSFSLWSPVLLRQPDRERARFLGLRNSPIPFFASNKNGAIYGGGGHGARGSFLTLSSLVNLEFDCPFGGTKNQPKQLRGFH